MKCCEYSAASLRHRITVERLTDAPDGMGGTVRSWSPIAANIRAAMQAISVREAVQLDAIRSPLDARAVIRYRADIKAQDRINFEGRTFEIVAEPVDLEFARRWLVLDLRAEGKQ